MTIQRPQISSLELPHLDQVFQMESGYVLDFSDRTISSFFAEELNVDIYDPHYSRNGTSKAKRLRCFLQSVDPGVAARALRRLWTHREENRRAGNHDEWAPVSVKKLFELIERLERGAPRLDAIERFSGETSLDELVASIERDIGANKPQVALDRLHTYCMKKFSHLLRLRGETVGQILQSTEAEQESAADLGENHEVNGRDFRAVQQHPKQRIVGA